MKRFLALLLVALIAGAFMLLPYRPVVVAGTAPDPGPYRFPAPVGGLRLHVFNTGMNRMSGFLVGAARPWRAAPAFVIEHPSRGLLVFDTGLSEQVARNGESALPIPLCWLMESRGLPDRTLDRQMREAGLEPGKVGTVVFSHLHDDHVGVTAAFSSASFLAGPGTAGRLHVQASRRRELGPADAKEAFAPFGGAFDLFADGSILVIPAAGHTDEDLMLFVALPEGPVLLAGDAVVHWDWLASDDVQRIPTDPDKAAAVRNQVRALVAFDPEVVVFPGHDLRRVPRGRDDIVLHHAEWFAPQAWPISP